MFGSEEPLTLTHSAMMSRSSYDRLILDIELNRLDLHVRPTVGINYCGLEFLDSFRLS
jgi:hypothetical protein